MRDKNSAIEHSKSETHQAKFAEVNKKEEEKSEVNVTEPSEAKEEAIEEENLNSSIKIEPETSNTETTDNGESVAAQNGTHTDTLADTEKDSIETNEVNLTETTNENVNATPDTDSLKVEENTLSEGTVSMV